MISWYFLSKKFVIFCDISGITSWSINAHHMQLAKKEQAFLFLDGWQQSILNVIELPMTKLFLYIYISWPTDQDAHVAAYCRKIQKMENKKWAKPAAASTCSHLKIPLHHTLVKCAVSKILYTRQQVWESCTLDKHNRVQSLWDRGPHTNWTMWFGILHKVTASHIIVIRLTKKKIGKDTTNLVSSPGWEEMKQIWSLAKWSAYFQGGMARGNRQGWNCQGNYVMNKLSANCCHMPKTYIIPLSPWYLLPWPLLYTRLFCKAVETQNCSLLLKLNFVKNPNPSPSPTRKKQLGFFGWLLVCPIHWVPGIYSANCVGHPFFA